MNLWQSMKTTERKRENGNFCYCFEILMAQCQVMDVNVANLVSHSPFVPSAFFIFKIDV